MAIQHDILKKYWGFDKFRPSQEDVVQSVLDGKDTLALLPTGGGKSLCFQIPAMCVEGICIVVSPLMALMQDQVVALRKRGIEARTVHSSMRYHEVDRVLDNCVYGSVKFLYVSPERLSNEMFQARVKKMKVSLIAVDEAHCISQWGYDFRPDYLRIGELRSLFPAAPILALTASATPEVVCDIQKQLLFHKEHVIGGSFARENLSYNVFHTENKEGKLIEILNKMPGCAIVYCATRQRTHAIADYIWKQGIASGVYHAGLTHAQRADAFKLWMSGKMRVVCATNAFGMGIDKPDVRLVLHADVPTQPEAYFQEAGRAGRDGKLAHAVLLWNEGDLDRAKKNHAIKFPPKSEVRDVYRALGSLLQLAIGSGKDQIFPIDLHALASLLGKKPAEVHASLQLLSLSGYLNYDEGSYSPARLNITMDRQALYSFQVGHPDLDPLLRLLLRMYGGMFEQYVTIRESEIATQLKTTHQQVISSLERLKQMEVLDYEPQTDQPRVTFLLDRQREEDVRIPESVYEMRKQSDEQRWHAMEKYLQREQCRSIQLLQYFGDKFPDPCGQCDVCRREKRVISSSKSFHALEDALLKLVLTQSPTVEMAVAMLNEYESHTVVEFIRRKLDLQELVMDDGLKLRLPG